MKEFDSIMNEKLVLIMSDQDLFLGATIKHVYPDLEHCRCVWHIVRNLSKIWVPKRRIRRFEEEALWALSLSDIQDSKNSRIYLISLDSFNCIFS